MQIRRARSKQNAIDIAKKYKKLGYKNIKIKKLNNDWIVRFDIK